MAKEKFDPNKQRERVKISDIKGGPKDHKLIISHFLALKDAVIAEKEEGEEKEKLLEWIENYIKYFAAKDLKAQQEQGQEK